jgi:diguanylate cyclase (GGDEF)-like protein
VTNERNLNIFVAVLSPFVFGALLWAFVGLPVGKIDAGLITLTILTVFCSCFLRIQLPRVNIHLTVNDGLIILAMLLYGGEIGLVLAFFETLASSLNMRRLGLPIRSRTIVLNSYFAALAVFTATHVVSIGFGPPETALQTRDLTTFVLVLSLMGLSLFLVNSVLVAIYTSIKREIPISKVWTENLFGAGAIYITGAVLAGAIFKSLEQVNLFLIALVVTIFGVIYLTFRGFIEDVKKNVDRAREAESARAEEAEAHVKELEHYVSELQRSSKELEASRESFRHAAYHDNLTGLPNRNFILEELRDRLAKGVHDKPNRSAVLFLNLNGFRTINDSLGHSTGDQIIRQVASRLTELTGPGDIAGHFGGDEFAIILSEAKNESYVVEFADKVARRIAEAVRFEGREVYTSVSIGIAFLKPEYVNGEDVLRDADIAMYNAKDNREVSAVFDSRMRDRVIVRQEVESDLRQAILYNELELFYQPIVRMDDVALAGFEALVRWNHPRRGLVNPADFIMVAEATGLIAPMTIQILRTACRQFVDWEERYNLSRSVMLSVNISVTHFADSGLVDQIRNIISETGMRPAALKLEITESAVVGDAENAIATLKRIKETGVAISIDDFGTGYSSLNYLHRFPIDYLKIDRSFVEAMGEGNENPQIVRTIIALAKSLNLEIIAEGIETKGQFKKLRRFGCQYGQGYLFSRPLPVSEVEAMLRENISWQDLLPSGRLVPSVRDTQIHLKTTQ